jgi:hypothetical protein
VDESEGKVWPVITSVRRERPPWRSGSRDDLFHRLRNATEGVPYRTFEIRELSCLSGDPDPLRVQEGRVKIKGD